MKPLWNTLASLVFGMVVGYGLHAMSPHRDKRGEEQALRDASDVREGSDATSQDNQVKLLRNRVRDLERQLAASGTSGKNAGDKPVSKAKPANVVPPAGLASGKPVEYPIGKNNAVDAGEGALPEPLASMASDDPEAFEEFRMRMEEQAVIVQSSHDVRSEVLGEIATESMSEEQLENHVKLLDTIAAIRDFELRSSPFSRTPVTEDDCMAYFEAQRQLGGLFANERRFLLEDFGASCGYDGGEFADAIEELYEITLSSFGSEEDGVPSKEFLDSIAK